MLKTTQSTEHTWTFRELPTHPLARTYRVTERMARRAFQQGRLHGAKPGLVVFFTDADIRAWILGSRSDVTK
jgi:hypothetical protein